MADWCDERVSWGSHGRRYEPAPAVDDNPWYDAAAPAPVASEPSDGVYVYLLESGSAYKIGISRNVPHRMATLGCASSSPVELVALRRGGSNLEARLHRRLKDYRMNGEWFRACPEVFEAFYREPERSTERAA